MNNEINNRYQREREEINYNIYMCVYGLVFDWFWYLKTDLTHTL